MCVAYYTITIIIITFYLFFYASGTSFPNAKNKAKELKSGMVAGSGLLDKNIHEKQQH